MKQENTQTITKYALFFLLNDKLPLSFALQWFPVHFYPRFLILIMHIYLRTPPHSYSYIYTHTRAFTYNGKKWKSFSTFPHFSCFCSGKTMELPKMYVFRLNACSGNKSKKRNSGSNLFAFFDSTVVRRSAVLNDFVAVDVSNFNV